MRTALLLCGQMRTFDHPKVLEYMNRLIEKFDCDVFISTWKNRGVSMWTIRNFSSEIYENDLDDVITKKSIDKLLNVRDYEILDYDDYLNTKCSDDIRSLLNRWYNNREFNLGISSNPQFYTMYVASKMKQKYEQENGFVYDVVIKSRPDFLQVNNNVEKYFDKLENTCYHINTGYFFVPNRVYDIFLMSDSKSMDIICNSWVDYDKLSESNYSRHLGKYDPCRLLYAQCMQNGIKTESFDKILGDVYRLESNGDYQSFENTLL